jgi:hypothetical protein
LSPFIDINFSPILKSSEISAFEAFSEDFFDSSGYKHLNISDHIFSVSPEVGRYREVDASSAQGKYDILVPIFEVSSLEASNENILQNLYSIKTFAKTIDYAIDTPLNALLPKTGASEIFFLPEDEGSHPSSLIVHPIAPMHNASTIVGVSVGALR